MCTLIKHNYQTTVYAHVYIVQYIILFRINLTENVFRTHSERVQNAIGTQLSCFVISKLLLSWSDWPHIGVPRYSPKFSITWSFGGLSAYSRNRIISLKLNISWRRGFKTPRSEVAWSHVSHSIPHIHQTNSFQHRMHVSM